MSQSRMPKHERDWFSISSIRILSLSLSLSLSLFPRIYT